MNALLEQLRVHHIGIACHHIANELPLFQTLGFQVEDSFSDEAQGVKGVFITHHLSPYRLELLENLPEATTLNSYLKARIKCYHIAFESKDIHRDTELILNAHNSNQAQQKDKNYFNGGGDIMNNLPKKARLIVPIMNASYFEKLCFIMLPNSLLIELVLLRRAL